MLRVAFWALMRRPLEASRDSKLLALSLAVMQRAEELE